MAAVTPTSRDEELIDVLRAFAPLPPPDDRAERVAILKQHCWSYDATTLCFTKISGGKLCRMSAALVRLLSLDDLAYSCAHPERVWP